MNEDLEGWTQQSVQHHNMEHLFNLPSSLAKALTDPWDYALGLRDGKIIRFGAAHLSDNGQWVHLTGGFTHHVGLDEDNPTILRGVPYEFERGLDVRVSDIMWCADMGH